MRKYPDAIAILILGLVLLVGTGVRAVAERIQAQQQQFRVRQLVTQEAVRESREAVRESLNNVEKEAHEGILEVKDALRESLRDEVRRAVGRGRP